MKIFKNIIIFTLIAIIVLGFNIPIYSAEITKIPTNTYANVIQVLDGDTIKVELSNKDTAYVKLKGINAKGFDTSYEYLTNTLLGQNVTLISDGNSYNSGKFNYMLVYFNGININNEMVENGYAVIDPTQSKGGTYNSLLAAQDRAKQENLGMWRFEDSNYSSISTSSSGSNNIQTKDRVNINTATRYQLETLLKDVSSDLAREIVKYRTENPFSNIQEIKFVKGFNKKIYDKNKNAITVCTNINTANEFELKTLDDLSDNYIRKIIDKRDDRRFSSTSQLYRLVPDSTYDKVSDYISIEDTNKIDISKGSGRANISLSSQQYLTDADVNYRFANDIIYYRKNGYTYKTLMELTKLNTNNINEQDLHYLEDNLNVFTDLNTDNLNELKAIFSKTTAEKIKDKTFSDKSQLKDIISNSEYDKVKDAIYVDKNKDEYVNINTATKEQMYSQNISTNEAYYFIQKRPIKDASQLPLDVTNINNKISLYTNINTASRLELQSLNNGINNSLIDKIIKYRDEDNFGSLEEVEQFFKTNNALNVYNNIKNYIVIR